MASMAKLAAIGSSQRTAPCRTPGDPGPACPGEGAARHVGADAQQAHGLARRLVMGERRLHRAGFLRRQLAVDIGDQEVLVEADPLLVHHPSLPPMSSLVS